MAKTHLFPNPSATFLGLVTTLVTALIAASPSISAAAPSSAPSAKVESLQDLKKLEKAINQVVESTLPATVSLGSTQVGAAGSGVVITPDGLILTAAHVIANSSEMIVIFPNGKQANAKVLGANFTRDSAMIQITDPAPAGGWPHAEVGHPKNLKLGDFVIAMGHPSGYDPSRTPPVRFGRYISQSINYFFNTDCAIIGGDSGGPLFNLKGEVIGIHSSIGNSLYANNHASLAGFHQDWDRLLAGDQWGELGRSGLQDENSPVLGIVTERISRNGLLIERTIPQGPAHKSGIKQGDLIQKVNNHDTKDLKSLRIELSKEQPGNTIEITLLRNNQPIKRTVKLASRKDIFKLLR